MTANGQVIGIGTGVAVNEYLREISERLGDGRLSVSLTCNFKLKIMTVRYVSFLFFSYYTLVNIVFN
jgi:ribose 5-phosphate isomerase